jgi:hypothetical protein
MPGQAAGPRRGGRHGSRPGPDEGRPAEALAGDEGARHGRGRRGRPEPPAPDREAPLGRDVVLDRTAPPGRDMATGRGTGRSMPPGQAGPPGQDAPPRRGAQRRRDAPPGRDEADSRPDPRRPAGRRRAPGWDEAATGPQDAGFAARDFGGRDGTRAGGGRARRRAEDRHAALDPATTDDRPGRGSRAGRSGARASRRRVRIVLLAVLAIVVVAAGAVAALKFVSRGSSRSHMLVAPSRLASYVRRPQLEQQMNARALQQQVIAKSAGQASHVVSAVYENSAGVSGSAPPQIFLFIGGNLAGESPAGFISSFTAQFKGAAATSPGSLGGQAACVDARGSAAGSVALCTWADSDTFGVVASPTMGLSQLAAQMRAIRPSVERPAR